MILGVIIGLVAGAVAGFFYQKSKAASLIAEKTVAEVQLSAKAEELVNANQKLEQTSEKLKAAEIAQASVEAQKAALAEKIAEQQEFLAKAQESLKMQFENLAQKQLKDSSAEFAQNSATKLNSLLEPLSKGIEKFQQNFTEENMQRFSLKNEVEKMASATALMNSTTENFTKALKGENKTQGNWGEYVLEKLLLDAGLKKGTNFKTQENLATDDNKRQMPDFIIYLPDDKHVVIDSKVSLTAYERYFSETDEAQKLGHARSFAESVRGHIKSLSAKNYQDNQNINALEFVIMFMPLEGTFQLATEVDKDLFSFGWNSRVVITSPATLFPVLKTISSIWKVEAQNRNTQEIIKTATSLYEKFLNFGQSLEAIGANIEKAGASYEKAKDQLLTGRGNAAGLAKKLADYGIDTKKSAKSLPKFMENDDAEEGGEVVQLERVS